MSDKNANESKSTWPCPSCGWEVDTEILIETPECPHGWLSLENLSLADIKAAFAGDPMLSIDPTPST